MFSEVLLPLRGNRDEATTSGLVTTRDEPALVGVLPYGQARTRCPPRVENVGVRTSIRAYPLEEVENQRFDGVGHGYLCGKTLSRDYCRGSSIPKRLGCGSRHAGQRVPSRTGNMGVASARELGLGQQGGTMFTRLLTWTGVTNVEGGLDYVRNTALPIVRQQKGYLGLSASVDRQAGALGVLSLWATEADRDASDSALAKVRDEGTEAIGGSLQVERLEEVAGDVVKPPEAGCALMVSQYSIDPAAVDDLIEFFRKDIAPQIKAAPGFCALRNMVDRSTGSGYVGTVWENKAAMEAQADAAQKRREAASTRGVTFGPISYRELVLIDNP